jgi:hypothetical protein
MVLHWSQDSLIGIVTRLLADDSGIGDRFPGGERVSSFLHTIQTGSGAHSACCTMGAVGCFVGGEADHSSPSAEVKNTSTLPYVFMALCLVRGRGIFHLFYH